MITAHAEKRYYGWVGVLRRSENGQVVWECMASSHRQARSLAARELKARAKRALTPVVRVPFPREPGSVTG